MRTSPTQSSSRMPEALVVSFNPLRFDSRVLRQIETVSQNFRVTVFAPGVGASESWTQFNAKVLSPRRAQGLESSVVDSKLYRFSMGILLFSGIYKWFHWSPRYLPFWMKRLWRDIGSPHFDLIIVNDADPLPLAFSIARGSPVVADLHEYAPAEEIIDTIHKRAMSRYRRWICRKYLGRCQAVTTVSESLRRLYREDFGVDSRVVLSAPRFSQIEPSHVNSNNLELVHHGIYRPDRGIEDVIEAVANSSRDLTLHLVLPAHSIEPLRGFATKLGLENRRIHFHDFVEPHNLIPFLNQFDLQVIFIPTTNPNDLGGLPNKFFESVQARLGIISGPSPEIAQIVEREDIGLVTDSFDPAQLSIALDSLEPESVSDWKKRSGSLAAKLCWENTAPNYRDFVRWANS